MRDTDKEQISSLLDNELDYSQTLTLAERLEGNSDLQEKFDRYALIHDALNEDIIVKDSFLEGVQHALKTKPIVLAPKRKKEENKKYIAVALAASIAIFSVTIFDVRLFTNTNPEHHSLASINSEQEQMLALEELQQTEDGLKNESSLEAQLVTFEK